jgi:hypothetical protein
MRRILPQLIIVFVLMALTGHAQSPPGINYQGVARNPDGKPLALKNIAIRINILKDGSNGEVEYQEIHTVTTNSFGLFTLVIGSGDALTGDFQFISWALGNKWLRVEMDPDGGSAFQIMGAQEFMSVPYAFYAKYAGSGAGNNGVKLSAGDGISIIDNVISNTGDADNNPANEYNSSAALGADHKLRITDGGGTQEVDLSPLITAGSAPQDLQVNGTKVKITNNPSATEVDLAPYLDNTDNQSLALTGNSLGIIGGSGVDLTPFMDNTDQQSLSLTGTNLAISNGTGVDLAGFMDNTDSQDLTITGNSLSLSNDATPVDLSSYLDNTDSQTLTFTGNSLSISGGNSISLASLAADNQNLNLAGSSLSISGGNSVSLAPFLDNTDKQDLQLSGNILSLSNDATAIDLTPYLDNTDKQTLAFSTSGTNRTLTISGGNNIIIDVADNDNSATNEIQDLSLSGNTLSLSSDVTPVNLSPYLDNTDAQSLTFTGSSLSISGGNSVNLASLATDNQSLNLAGTSLSISGGNSVSLGPFLDNTDNQDLTLTGNSLSLTNDGTPVNLAPYLDNTDNQDLQLSGNILSLSNDATAIDLTPYLDNTDKQTLAFSTSGTNRTLTISGGNNITIDVADNDNSMTNEIQNLSLSGNTLSLSSDITPVDLSSYLDNTDAQTLTFSGNNLSILGGNSVNLASLATDNQSLTLAGSNLSISGGNSVSLAPFLDNTDNQDLTLTGNSLSLTNDGTPVNLAPYLDNTDNQDLQLSGNTLSLTNDATSINLAPYLDNTDNQNVTVNAAGTNRVLSITGGTGATFSVADNDNDPVNEIQTLSYDGATKQLQISGSNNVTIAETQNIGQVLTQGNDAGGSKITNLGNPAAATDAANKQYVDAGDAALTSRISNNYAFKAGFSYSNVLGLGSANLPIVSEDFDDFNVVNSTNFTATAAGTYVFVIDGSVSTILGSPAINILYNGTKYPVSIGSNQRYNSTFMFRLTVGQTVSLVADGLTVGASVSGSFFGYKLL